MAGARVGGCRRGCVGMSVRARGLSGCRLSIVSTEVFLFTDIVASTRRWGEDRGWMRWALAVHDRLLGDALVEAGGEVFKHTGDGLVARFVSAASAVEGAVASQRALSGQDWGGSDALTVRVAIHAGDADRRDADWFGPALNRCARLLGIAHGGQILLSGAAQALCVDGLSSEMWMVDLGRHRLRDLLNAENVWQISAPGLLSSFPPLRSFDDRLGNLPVQPTGFLGRVSELAELRGAVVVERLITLVGAGGMGKTRLALQAAADVVDEFPDGVWFVELAPLQTSEGLDHTTVAALRLDPRPGLTAREVVIDALRERRALVLLDNCEHVRAAAAGLARDLLAQCPRVRLLATSRAPLRVSGEQLWPVGPLDAEGTAVELFAARAAAVKRGLVLGVRERNTVVEMCRRLDGMPLAIELAASRVRSMTVDELAVRLDQRFKLLSWGRVDESEPRHATLEAVVSWSYDLLEPVEQRLLCRLSVFAGSFDLDAAHQVCVVGAGDAELDESDDLATLNLLDALVNHSLLVGEEREGGTRFRLLETIRQWAAPKLGDARPEVTAAHAAYYAGLLERFRLADGRRLALETDNLRVAVYYGLGQGDTDLVLSMVRRLWRHVSVSMRLLEAEEWTNAALALPGVEHHPDALWAHVLLAAVGNITADPRRLVREARAAIAFEAQLHLKPEVVPRFQLCLGEVWLGNFEAADRAGRDAFAATRPEQLSIRLDILFQLVIIAVYADRTPDDTLLASWRDLAAHAASPLNAFTVSFTEGVIATRHEPLRAAEHFEAAVGHLEAGTLDYVLGGAACAYAGLLRSEGNPRAALTSLDAGLAYYHTAHSAFGVRRLLRDFVPALCALGDHAAVAVIDGAAAPPALRPLQVSEAIARSRANLGEKHYAQALQSGQAMTDDQLEQFIADRLQTHSPFTRS